MPANLMEGNTLSRRDRLSARPHGAGFRLIAAVVDDEGKKSGSWDKVNTSAMLLRRRGHATE